MIAFASLIIVVLVSLLITRVATVALTLTGLSRESARFQARSALSGVGFTTSEAETIVNHPIRRRVVMVLMLLGSAGIATVVGTLVLSFANTDASQRGTRLGVLIGVLFVLWLLARNAWVDRRLSPLIARVLCRAWDLDARDYAALLHVSGDFAVLELAVRDGDWIAGRTLRELELREEGAVVLGVTRVDGSYVGVPRFDTALDPGDTILVYGRRQRLAELDRRPAGPEGDHAHERAVEEQRALCGKRPATPARATALTR